MLSSDNLSNIRVFVLGITGLTCLTYAVLALLLGRADPMPWWIPGIAGVGSALVISIAAFAAGKRNTQQAIDEGYFADTHKAQRLAFWIALFLYPLFGILLANDAVNFQVAFAAMGTLTGAAFLLLFVWFDIKGRL